MAKCVGCGKTRFLSRAAARKARRRMKNGRGLNAYRCPFDPSWWHLGHLPIDVVHGLRGRDEITPPRRPKPPRRRDGAA